MSFLQIDESEDKNNNTHETAKVKFTKEESMEELMFDPLRNIAAWIMTPKNVMDEKNVPEALSVSSDVGTCTRPREEKSVPDEVVAVSNGFENGAGIEEDHPSPTEPTVCVENNSLEYTTNVIIEKATLLRDFMESCMLKIKVGISESIFNDKRFVYVILGLLLSNFLINTLLLHRGARAPTLYSGLVLMENTAQNVPSSNPSDILNRLEASIKEKLGEQMVASESRELRSIDLASIQEKMQIIEEAEVDVLNIYPREVLDEMIKLTKELWKRGNKLSTDSFNDIVL